MTPEDLIKEMMLYVLNQLSIPYRQSDHTLCKILFDADYAHYIYFGRAITDYRYVIHNAEPAPYDFRALQIALQDAGDTLEYMLTGGRVLIDPQRQEKQRVFDDNCIRVLAASIGNHTGSPTFRLTGWERLAEGDLIPYDSISFA